MKQQQKTPREVSRQLWAIGALMEKFHEANLLGVISEEKDREAGLFLRRYGFTDKEIPSLIDLFRKQTAELQTYSPFEMTITERVLKETSEMGMHRRAMLVQ